MKFPQQQLHAPIISKAHNSLGFSPSVIMEEGLPLYFEWARANMTLTAVAGGAQ